MLYGIVLGNKNWGKKEEGGMFRVMVFVFPSHCCAWSSPAFLEMAAHLPAKEKYWMNPLFCFAWVRSFCFTYSTVFISTYVFSHFYPSDSVPRPTGRERVNGCVGLSCWLGLNLNTWKSESPEWSIHVLDGPKEDHALCWLETATHWYM